MVSCTILITLLWAPLGRYLYMESSYPRRTGDTARLASFPISGTAPDCKITFWSHMKGDQVGSLRVLLRYSYGSGPSDFQKIDEIVGK